MSLLCPKEAFRATPPRPSERYRPGRKRRETRREKLAHSTTPVRGGREASVSHRGRRIREPFSAGTAREPSETTNTKYA